MKFFGEMDYKSFFYLRFDYSIFFIRIMIVYI